MNKEIEKCKSLPILWKGRVVIKKKWKHLFYFVKEKPTKISLYLSFVSEPH